MTEIWQKTAPLNTKQKCKAHDNWKTDIRKTNGRCILYRHIHIRSSWQTQGNYDDNVQCFRMTSYCLIMRYLGLWKGFLVCRCSWVCWSSSKSSQSLTSYYYSPTRSSSFTRSFFYQMACSRTQTRGAEWCPDYKEWKPKVQSQVEKFWMKFAGLAARVNSCKNINFIKLMSPNMTRHEASGSGTGITSHLVGGLRRTSNQQGQQSTLCLLYLVPQPLAKLSRTAWGSKGPSWSEGSRILL